MCMIDNADGYVDTINSPKLRRARKPHKCMECHRVIQAKEQYEHMVYKWDGEIVNRKLCLHCRVAENWLEKECHGFLYGRVQEDIVEHAESGNYGMPLARLAVGMRRQWEKINGELMSVQPLPPTTWDKVAPATKGEQ